MGMSPATDTADRQHPGYLGLGGRLAEGPGLEMIEAGFEMECADAAILHDGLALADIAHTLILAEAGILRSEAASELLRALLDLASIPHDRFPYDPGLGDPWNSRQHQLTLRVGGLASWLTIGRPRREAGRVAFRIALRARLLVAHEALTRLARSLLYQARLHCKAVMPDYTYLQPAQPTTFGYLLLGYLQPTLRAAERFRQAYGQLNRSPAGVGGVGGTSLNLDRWRLAQLLGFDSVAVHARDAMWQTDCLVDLLAALAGSAVQAGQIAADLEVFASPAFGFVELADAHSRSSALMPQKKNPYPLAIVRGAAGVLAGRLAGLLSVLRTGSARTDHFVFAYGEVPRALDLYSTTHRLLAATIRGLAVNREAMASSAARDFIGAADLAEQLALRGWLDHASAHRLIGAAVRKAVGSGRNRIMLADLHEAARELSYELAPDDSALEALLDWTSDPTLLVASREVTGGTSHAQISRMLRSASDRLRREDLWRGRASDRLQTAEQKLLSLASELATIG